MKCQHRVDGRYTAQTLLCAVLESFNIFIIFCKTAFLDPDAMFYLFCTPGAWKTCAPGAQLRRPVRGFLLAPLGAVRLLGAALFLEARATVRRAAKVEGRESGGCNVRRGWRA